jgi:hypothetical protein
MKEISVQSDVRPPQGNPRCAGLYPWLSMVVNDSFVVEGRVAAAAARVSFFRYQGLKRIPQEWKCVQRTEGDGLIRLWAVLGE